MLRLLVVTLACLFLLVDPPLVSSRSGATAPSLRWSAPKLRASRTVRLPATSTHLELDPSKDYILKLPPHGLVGALWIEGGHDVVLIGGSITVPSSANQLDNDADNTDAGVYIKNATGTVHIEGVAISAEPNVMFDGIDINAPQATVQIENVRISGVYGSAASMHADAVQTWGGVRDLRIDHLSIDGDYQGLTINPDLGPVGTAEIQNVDITIDHVPSALASQSVGGGHMIWLTRGATSCDSPTVHFQNVYIDATASDGETGGDTVWPQVGHTTLACHARERQGRRVTWPTLPITGFVTLGAPPGGHFVPSGSVGNGYRSLRRAH